MRVEVTGADAQTVTAGKILIATGSAPIELPAAPFDGTRIVSSTEALSLPARCRSGCWSSAAARSGSSSGSVWSRLGAEVVVVELLDRLVPGMDRQMAGLLQKIAARSRG